MTYHSLVNTTVFYLYIMVPHINYYKDYIVHTCILIVDVWPALITIDGFVVMLLQFHRKQNLYLRKTLLYYMCLL